MERTFDKQTIKQRFGIIGNSPLLNHAIEVAMQVAPTDMTVLINGESGSGKESFSKIIHDLSKRKHGKFIAVNCGAIPSGTIDSELFGHEKGSFTGAHETRKGYFETVDKGTIFLDEIGELPLETQSRLLRVLENKEFIKVGSSKVQKTDVRVVAATNKDLFDLSMKGKFREDLYYRLSTVPIAIPPLRDRGDDVYLLFRKFSADFSEQYRVKPITLGPEGIVMLQKYRFPGNIRELKNITERISILETNRELDANTLMTYLPKRQTSNLPMLSSTAKEEQSKFSERDILYKFLFEMKNDLNELKKVVFESLSNPDDATGGTQAIQKYNQLFNDIQTHEKAQPNLVEEEIAAYNTTDTNQTFVINTKKEEPYNEEEIHEHVEVEENLSLEDMEKNMIIRALEKHKNKRKYAAKDLGISERTLYRKLKEYDID